MNPNYAIYSINKLSLTETLRKKESRIQILNSAFKFKEKLIIENSCFCKQGQCKNLTGRKILLFLVVPTFYSPIPAK